MMRVYSGRLIDPFSADLNILDIAHGLAGEYRYSNQTPERLTVAEHSVTVAWFAEALFYEPGLGPTLAVQGPVYAHQRAQAFRAHKSQDVVAAAAALGLAGLLHDAQEVVWRDVAQPVKQRIRDFLPEYKTMEDDLQMRLLAKFGVSVPLDPIIHHADRIAWEYESPRLWAGRYGPWSGKNAARRFLSEYEYYANASGIGIQGSFTQED